MKSPMLDLPGAVEAERPDEGVAAHYGDPMREQRVMSEQLSLVDRSNRGVIKVTGPDRLSWLHSLTSQHLERLTPGVTQQALVLSPQGHLEHHLTLTDDGTATWIHVEPHTASALVDYLNSMRFMLRVEVEDLIRRAGGADPGLRAGRERIFGWNARGFLPARHARPRPSWQRQSCTVRSLST